MGVYGKEVFVATKKTKIKIYEMKNLIKSIMTLFSSKEEKERIRLTRKKNQEFLEYQKKEELARKEKKEREEKIMTNLSKITDISNETKLEAIKYCFSETSDAVRGLLDRKHEMVAIQVNWSIPKEIPENDFLAICYIILSMRSPTPTFKPEIYNSLRWGEYKIHRRGFGLDVVFEN